MRKIIVAFLLYVSVFNLVLAQNNNPVVNIYVDNTGSMFGYFSKGNEFEWAISNLVTSINLSGLSTAGNIHFYYINSSVFPFNGSASAFLNGVKIHNAKTYKGDLGKTCMSDFFTKVINATGKDTISILISDFIISPGKGNDATSVLASEKNAISNIVKSILNQQSDFAMAMYRMNSSFDGKYYDCQDNFKKINGVRPYYMWVISNKSLISKFRKEIQNNKIDNGRGVSAVTDSYVFINSSSIKDPNFCVIKTSTGSIISGSKGVQKASLSNGKYTMVISVNLSEYKLLGGYLTDVSNYLLNNKGYKLVKVEKKANGRGTHCFYIETTKVPSHGVLSISLKGQTPSWVSKYNIDADDCNMILNEENIDKTFGIKVISDAVYDAFNFKNNNIFKISININ